MVLFLPQKGVVSTATGTNKPRDTRGEGAVGQGHTRYDCKITAMVVTNQRRDNTPTGGREALWGPLTFGAMPAPPPPGFLGDWMGHLLGEEGGPTAQRLGDPTTGR